MARGGRPALTEAEVEERRAVILTAVLDQIGERGAAGVRMKDVARAARVSVGSIQYYFDTREELVLEAFRRHSESVIEKVQTSFRRGLPPWEALVRTFHDFLRVEGFGKRTRLWVEFVAASTRDAQLLELLDSVFRAWKQVVRDVIDAGVAEGAFAPPVDTEVVVDALLAQLDGFEIAFAIGSPGTDIARIELVLQETAACLLGLQELASPPSSVRKE